MEYPQVYVAAELFPLLGVARGALNLQHWNLQDITKIVVVLVLGTPEHLELGPILQN